MARKKPTTDHDRADYEKRKADQRDRIHEISAAGRDIGELPPVINPARRDACKFDFRLHCLTYHPQTFVLPFSQDHLRAIHKIERAVLHGDLFAYAMPRGSGKTSLAETSVEWALLHGHRRFGVLIGADAEHAEMMLDSIKIELEVNELLFEDFPEVCYPVRRLDGIAHRCKGQTCGGERTRILWASDRVVFPCVPGSAVGGSCIRVAGITGRIRGMKHALPTGEKIRPDYVVPDDPQTDESANSPSQVAKLERILHGAVLGLAGPKKKIAGVMPCTVIRQGDLADRSLDHKLHPEWFGERAKLLYTFPARMDLWEQYRTLQAESQHAGRHGEEATEFYRANRIAMDEGSVVGWAERFNNDEISALQHAMNLWMRDENAFWSEYQNEPKAPTLNDREEITASQICEKLNRLERGVVPIEADTLTAMIDIQANSLWYVVAAWQPEFQSCVIDYGVFPSQSRKVFQLRDVQPTLQDFLGIKDLEASIYAGLAALVAQTVGSSYRTNGGSPAKISRCLIDANWGQVTDVVYRFCRESVYSANLTPSHGRGVTADNQPMGWWTQKPGEKRGLNWVMPQQKPGRVRHILFDTNFWKSFVHGRLAIPIGGKGDMTLFGDKPTAHRLFSEHLTAETRTQTIGHNRTVDVWKLKPHKPDNHWFDCLVGCAVGANMEGIALKSQEQATPGRKVVVKTFAQIQAERKKRAR